MNVSPVYDDRYIKTKRRIYTNFCGLDLPEDGVEFESFTLILVSLILFLLMETNIICKYIIGKYRQFSL